MKHPNGYGQIIKLSGKRRKRYAVRISCGHKERIAVQNKAVNYAVIDKYAFTYRKSKNDYVADANDRIENALIAGGIPYRTEFVRKYKYLEYFEKASEAHAYLAQMNRGEAVREHASIASEPSFRDVYDEYIEFAMSLNKPPSKASLRAYEIGFNNWSDVHDMRFKSITAKQLQACLTKHGTMAKSSVGRMLTILKKMYKYAIANQICDMDLSQYLFAEHTDEKKIHHAAFTDDEIKKLWGHAEYEGAKIALILIYTGLRCSEFLTMESMNVHIAERYMVGGIKTAAGRNRVIPIHKDIVPFIEELYDPKQKYLYHDLKGNAYDYRHFRDLKWNKYMDALGMKHYTHDCRHTCATKLEQFGISDLHKKLILGHTIRDITNGVYTHVSKEALIADMDKVCITCVSQVENSGF